MQPLVTVFLPNYNHAHYLPVAIQSVLDQEYANFELLIIDDGSTDQSIEVIVPYCERDRRIRLICHKENRGIYFTMREGLSLAQGEYFHGLAADDFYTPSFLSQSIEALAHYPGIGLSACDLYVYAGSSQRRQNFLSGVSKPSLLPAPALAPLFQTSRLKFSGRNCLVSTSLLKEYGGFQEKFYASCDWLVFTKIAFSKGVVYIPQPLVCWREIPTSVTGKVLKNRELRKKMYRNILEDLAQADPRLFAQFKISGELGCVLKFAPLEFFKKRKFWPFFPNILKRYLRRRLRIGISKE